MLIGKTLRKIRLELGLTQEEMAGKLSNMSIHTYRKYEQNLREPKIDILQKIAEALEIPLTQLMGVAPIGKTFINEEQQITHVLARKNDNIPPEEAKMMIYPYINYIADKEGYIVGSGSEYEDIVDSVDDLIRGKILRLIDKRGKEIK